MLPSMFLACVLFATVALADSAGLSRRQARRQTKPVQLNTHQDISQVSYSSTTAGAAYESYPSVSQQFVNHDHNVRLTVCIGCRTRSHL